MQDHTEVTLPSGKKLQITLSSFAEGKALYKAVLEESRVLKLDPSAEADFNFFKDVFCTAFSSDKIEKCLEACMKRALYDGKRINADTFESVEAREDYTSVCWEVAQFNLRPFTKSLWQQLGQVVEKLNAFPQSK
jgi:hypothetical protein